MTTVKSKPNFLELNFESQKNRQEQEVSFEGLLRQVHNIKSGNKFKFSNNKWHSVPYKGYALVSMLESNPGNGFLISEIEKIQNGLAKDLDKPENYYMLPKDSYHQTVVNTLSGKRFEEHIIDKGLEAQYPEIIEEALSDVSIPKVKKPIEMKIIGLGIFGTSFGVLGTFDRQQDWETIMDFREKLYSNPKLNIHDIKRTRPFISHITLGYIDGKLSLGSRLKFAEVCHSYNLDLREKELRFLISNTELRSYENLSHFKYDPAYPSFSFV